MRTVVIWLLALAATMVVVTVTTVAVAYWRLRRRNRVSPDVRSPAPVGWLWSPAPAARLHRRLRGIVRAARLVAGRDPGLGGAGISALAAELEAEAVALDDHLVVAAACAKVPRRRLLRDLGRAVDKLEVLTTRLAAAARDGAAVPALSASRPGALEQVAEHLDALEVARGELVEVEAAAGLHGCPPPPRSH